jgi:hypothetical protein
LRFTHVHELLVSTKLAIGFLLLYPVYWHGLSALLHSMMRKSAHDDRR